MGWYYQSIRGRSTADKDAFLSSEIEQIADKPGKSAITVLKSTFVGTTWYAAVQITPEDEPRYTVAFVYLTAIGSDGNFGYKPMDESMGPNEDSCPLSIMKLLTPLEQVPGTHEYAIEWRRRVEEHHRRTKALRSNARRMTPGTIISFETPVKLTDGMTYRRFIAHRIVRRNRQILAFEPIDADGRRAHYYCRLNRRCLSCAAIEPPSATKDPEPAPSVAA
jgi:hypothetical protein